MLHTNNSVEIDTPKTSSGKKAPTVTRGGCWVTWVTDINNGDILNVVSYSEGTCYWEAHWFGNGNITINMLCTLIGKNM
jgi:hypothetical protein